MTEFIRFKQAYQLIEKKRAERRREAELENEMAKSRSHEQAKGYRGDGGGPEKRAFEVDEGYAEKNEL